MAFEKLVPGDLIEVRAPGNNIKCWANIVVPAERWDRSGFVHPQSFKSGIVGIVIGEAESASEKHHGFRYWTMVFTYDCRVVWFPTKHLVLRKRGRA